MAADSPSSPSPLAHSTRISSVATSEGEPDTSESLELHRARTAPGIEQPHQQDHDGYEEPSGDEDNDERARDVITGRLIHGHIVDEELPSPSMSVRSGSIQGLANGQRSSRLSDEDAQLPDPMMSSFISTT